MVQKTLDGILKDQMTLGPIVLDRFRLKSLGSETPFFCVFKFCFCFETVFFRFSWSLQRC